MEEKGLTKRDSQCLKGIAILLMLFHHLYCETSRFAQYSVSFYPFTQDFVVNVSILCKICVSIFAFITGYGLLKSYAAQKKTSLRDTEIWTVSRLLKTMSGYYFIFLLALIVTQCLGKRPTTVYF